MSDRFRNALAFAIASVLIAILLSNHYQTETDATSELDLGSSTTLSRAGLAMVSSSNSDSAALARAVDLLTQAKQIDAKDPVALFGLGWALQLQKQDGRALEQYDQALSELNELSKFSLFNRSFLKEGRGDITGALADVTAALALAPDFEQARTRQLLLQRRIAETNG